MPPERNASHKQMDGSIAYAAMYLANRMSVSAIIAVTEYGQTPRIMSRVRTGIPIYALSRRHRSRTKMAFLRDVYSFSLDLSRVDSSRQLVTRIVEYFKDIFGAPDFKTKIVREFLDNKNIDANDCVFIGDSPGDFNAAFENSVPFIYRGEDQSDCYENCLMNFQF